MSLGKSKVKVCGKQLAGDSLKRYYVAEHLETYRNLSDELSAKESEALIVKLHTQQELFTKHCTLGNAAVLSWQVMSHVTKSLEKVNDREFVKEC